MKQQHYLPIMAAAILWMLGSYASPATTYTWKVDTTGDWFTASNWTNNSGYPADGDEVVISNGGAGVLLANNTAQLSSFVLGGAASVDTLTFSNWDTLLSATNITILTDGTLTCSGPFTNNAMTNRVYLSCSNLTVLAGGKIDVNGLGYQGGTGGTWRSGNGPGQSGDQYYNGACHGGLGGYNWLAPYGSLTAPEYPGSGGQSGWNDPADVGGSGGGAVRINAPSGKVVINGSISADASAIHTGSFGSTGGSGGSVYITCQNFAGTNGNISANGSAGSFNPSAGGGGGGGGRIAVIYSSIEPDATSVTFSARGAIGKFNGTFDNNGDIGTLYFPDNQLLTTTIKHSGQWRVPGFTNWSVDSLTVSGGWIRFPGDGFRLTVTNDLLITGSGGQLDLGGDQYFLPANVYHVHRDPYTSANGPTLQIGGNLTVTNNGKLWVYAGLTNGSVPDYGALVNVASNIRVAASSWISPVAHWTNGGTVLFRMQNLTVAQNGGFDANIKGYSRAYAVGGLAGSHWGYGPGRGSDNWGGGYGGQAGGNGNGNTSFVGQVYGNLNAPILPGSGGGSAGMGHEGEFGGGAVRISASDTVAFDGVIKANSTVGNTTELAPGGSGGGIYLICKTFIGSTDGILQANGGNSGGASSSGGGGGRIAVWRRFDKSSGSVATYVNGGSSAGAAPTYGPGTNGTVVWGWLPPAGMIVTVR